ncbi:MAG: biopolymer transporter ExbD [Planctomycetia bacterium]|nr:biopolymer transporter ExbD [Planctomycetia bacterium]
MAVNIKQSKTSGTINFTPLIDCVFLLLIFFLVGSKLEEEERELPIVLPQASEARPLTSKPKELFVNVGRDGQYVVQSTECSAGQLEQLLKQASSNNPGRQSVIIRADERCEWKHVVLVMDLCNKANIRDYRVTTAPRDG